MVRALLEARIAKPTITSTVEFGAALANEAAELHRTRESVSRFALRMRDTQMLSNRGKHVTINCYKSRLDASD